MICIICGGSHNIVEVRKIVNMRMDFDGITYANITKPVCYCEECFNTQVWNKTDNKKVGTEDDNASE